MISPWRREIGSQGAQDSDFGKSVSSRADDEALDQKNS
jgi:hypothetical protein